MLWTHQPSDAPEPISAHQVQQCGHCTQPFWSSSAALLVADDHVERERGARNGKTGLKLLLSQAARTDQMRSCYAQLLKMQLSLPISILHAPWSSLPSSFSNSLTKLQSQIGYPSSRGKSIPPSNQANEPDTTTSSTQDEHWSWPNNNNCFNLWINQQTQVSDANLQELQLWHTIALKNPPSWKHTWALQAATTYEFFRCCKSTQLKLEMYTTLQHLLQTCLIKIKKSPFSRLRKGKVRLTFLQPATEDSKDGKTKQRRNDQETKNKIKHESSMNNSASLTPVQGENTNPRTEFLLQIRKQLEDSGMLLASNKQKHNRIDKTHRKGQQRRTKTSCKHWYTLYTWSATDTDMYAMYNQLMLQSDR